MARAREAKILLTSSSDGYGMGMLLLCAKGKG